MDAAGARPRKLIVVSAPSGGGKTTIARAILARFSGTTFSVSATTRSKRETEIDGVDYYFLDKEEFRRRVDAGEFVEWEEIYGQYYGTLAREVERGLNAGKIILFDVDVRGALSIKRRYPEALLLFIRPPSLEALLERLRNRRTEDAATVAKRMERVPLEFALGTEFDHQIVNDVLETAIAKVEEIVAAYIHTSS